MAELVGQALENSPALAAKDARIEEARAGARQARAWAGPTVGVMAGRAKQTAAEGSRYELSAAQPFPLSGAAGLRGRLSDLETERLRVERKASKTAVVLAVATGAFEFEANRRKAAFAESRRRRLELVSAYLSGRPFPTPQRRAESRIVANRSKGVVVEYLEHDAAWRISLEKLRAYVRLSSQQPPKIEVPWLTGGRPMDEAAWLDKALSENPDLRAHALDLQGADLRKTLQRREGLPEPSLIASYEKGHADVVGTDYALGISLAFPSWNGNRSGIASAESRRLAEERELAFARQAVRAELGRALAEYELARQAVSKYPREALAEAERQLDDADDGFRKGQVDLLTFLELDASAAEMVDRTYDAQVELVEKAARLLDLAADQDPLAAIAGL